MLKQKGKITLIYYKPKVKDEGKHLLSNYSCICRFTDIDIAIYCLELHCTFDLSDATRRCHNRNSILLCCVFKTKTLCLTLYWMRNGDCRHNNCRTLNSFVLFKLHKFSFCMIFFLSYSFRAKSSL
jgi:hypothetical protein